jgi:hypothetical protein
MFTKLGLLRWRFGNSNLTEFSELRKFFAPVMAAILFIPPI